MRKRRILVLLILVLLVTCGFVGCANNKDNDNDDGNKQDELSTLATPENITAENRVVTWDIVENATGYLVEFAGTEYEVEDNRFELYFFTGQGNKYIRVKAIGDGVKYDDSNWAAETIKISALTQNGYTKKVLNLPCWRTRADTSCLAVMLISRGLSPFPAILRVCP